MSIATFQAKSPLDFGEQRTVLVGISYATYETVADALGGKPGVRFVFVDGRLSVLTASRRHEWYARRLAELVKAVATASGVRWGDAGSSTYRARDRGVGVEGDETFYFGANAELMRGPLNIDLATQPPPDLAIEVEVSHPADDAMFVYGRLGVPEVWRFDVDDWNLTFWLRRTDGGYDSSPNGRAFPALVSKDILDQLRLAEGFGAADWYAQLNDWVRVTILPRMAEG